MNWGFWGVFGWLLMLAFWVAVIVGIVLVVRWLVAAGGHATSSREESALEILKRRYARGEIGKDEFEAKKKDLQ